MPRQLRLLLNLTTKENKMMETLMDMKKLETLANKEIVQNHLKNLNSDDGMSVLESLVHQLTKKEKRIVLLKFWENMNHDEIAHALRMSLSQVNLVLDNALSSLRKMIITRLVDLESDYSIEDNDSLVG